MKRLMMIIAIAVAANFAAFGVQPASANDAHHPAQATKGKKAKALAPKRAKNVKSSQMKMMNCPMMKSGKMMQGGMMQGGMMKGAKMKCPMMGGGKMHHRGMMKNMGSNMGPGMMGSSGTNHAMHHGDAMMGQPKQCQVTDRERGFGYRGAC